MNDIRSFAPIANEVAAILILGSMPSQVSLSKKEYYGHKKNAFWPIILNIFNKELDYNKASYRQRENILLTHKIALWDVLQSCHRPGSLDAAITMSSIKSNDFLSFFSQHKKIQTVFFNGAKAESIYMKTVLSQVKSQFSYLSYVRLPSTSPAYAAMPFRKKLDIWRRSIVTDAV